MPILGCKKIVPFDVYGKEGDGAPFLNGGAHGDGENGGCTAEHGQRWHDLGGSMWNAWKMSRT